MSARAAALLVCAAVCLACVSRPVPPPGTRRVAVVGVDGATWAVLSPLMSAGGLPHLARMYRGGSAGLLRSLEPMEPAALWTSVATGKSRAAHAIQRSVEKAPGRYAVRPVTADRRRAPAIWTIASARGLPVGLSGWPVTFPAETVDGFVLADGLDPDAPEERGYMHPAGALTDREGDETPAIDSLIERTAALDPVLAEAMREDIAVLRRAISLYRVYQPRLLMLRLRSVDLASHRHWPLGSEPPVAPHSGSDAVLPPDGPLAGAYALVDACLGGLLEQLPEETALLVLSDHGFRASRPTDDRRVDMEALLERLGYLARGVGGEPDWPRTRLFRLEEGDEPERLIYLNLKGREERGSVEPARAPALRAEAARVLRSLASGRGDPLFLKVAEVDATTPGEADLEARENPGLDDSAEVALPGGERVPAAGPYRGAGPAAGTHDPAGMLLAYGSGVAAGRAGWAADLYDVTPTVLFLLGLPLASDMPGRPIEPLLGAPVPAEHPMVPSYNALPPAPAPLPRSERAVQRALDRLRAAGHLN